MANESTQLLNEVCSLHLELLSDNGKEKGEISKDIETIADELEEEPEQIEEKQYATQLIAKGIPQERIRKYGFAFEGKKVLIG